MSVFEAGQTLQTKSICDSECVFTGTVVKRTTKTVTIETRIKGLKRVKIHTETNGAEYCFPFGQYSMAPIFRA